MVFVYDHGEGDEAVLKNNVFVRMEDGRPRQQGEAKVRGSGRGNTTILRPADF